MIKDSTYGQADDFVFPDGLDDIKPDCFSVFAKIIRERVKENPITEEDIERIISEVKDVMNDKETEE